METLSESPPIPPTLLDVLGLVAANGYAMEAAAAAPVYRDAHRDGLFTHALASCEYVPKHRNLHNGKPLNTTPRTRLAHACLVGDAARVRQLCMHGLTPKVDGRVALFLAITADHAIAANELLAWKPKASAQFFSRSPCLPGFERRYMPRVGAFRAYPHSAATVALVAELAAEYCGGGGRREPNEGALLNVLAMGVWLHMPSIVSAYVCGLGELSLARWGEARSLTAMRGSVVGGMRPLIVAVKPPPPSARRLPRSQALFATMRALMAPAAVTTMDRLAVAGHIGDVEWVEELVRPLLPALTPVTPSPTAIEAIWGWAAGAVAAVASLLSPSLPPLSTMSKELATAVFSACCASGSDALLRRAIGFAPYGRLGSAAPLLCHHEKLLVAESPYTLDLSPMRVAALRGHVDCLITLGEAVGEWAARRDVDEARAEDVLFVRRLVRAACVAGLSDVVARLIPSFSHDYTLATGVDHSRGQAEYTDIYPRTGFKNLDGRDMPVELACRYRRRSVLSILLNEGAGPDNRSASILMHDLITGHIDDRGAMQEPFVTRPYPELASMVGELLRHVSHHSKARAMQCVYDNAMMSAVTSGDAAWVQLLLDRCSVTILATHDFLDVFSLSVHMAHSEPVSNGAAQLLLAAADVPGPVDCLR